MNIKNLYLGKTGLIKEAKLVKNNNSLTNKDVIEVKRLFTGFSLMYPCNSGVYCSHYVDFKDNSTIYSLYDNVICNNDKTCIGVGNNIFDYNSLQSVSDIVGKKHISAKKLNALLEEFNKDFEQEIVTRKIVKR